MDIIKLNIIVLFVNTRHFIFAMLYYMLIEKVTSAFLT